MRTDSATHGIMSRRTMLRSSASGFGYLAFAALAHSLAARRALGSDGPLAPKETHFPARAKRVIFLCMNGGPSHIDLFDHKPQLKKHDGADTADSSLRSRSSLMASPFAFERRGESGLWMSELMPRLAAHADDLCVIRSMRTDLPNHSQAFLQMHTGSFQFTRPSIGAWTVYGLGTENANLPGFLTLNPPSENGGARNYGNAFLPSVYQATKIGTNQIPAFYRKLLGVDAEPGPPLKNVRNERMTRSVQRRQLDLVTDLNRSKLRRDTHNPEIEGAIQSLEIAYRMQDRITDVMELGREAETTLDAYGIGSGRPTDSFGKQCLLARRMIEAGVRFVEVTAPVNWDHHFRLAHVLPEACMATDQPIAALLSDLKQRGLLRDTLVIWAGEFGRTPYAQSGTGRDHNNKGYTIWMAGGGVRPGTAYGATDELGYEAVENALHIHDWHATLLHLLGFDHRRLTFNYAGRDFRLTDVHGNVADGIVAG